MTLPTPVTALAAATGTLAIFRELTAVFQPHLSADGAEAMWSHVVEDFTPEETATFMVHVAIFMAHHDLFPC